MAQARGLRCGGMWLVALGACRLSGSGGPLPNRPHMSLSDMSGAFSLGAGCNKPLSPVWSMKPVGSRKTPVGYS